MTVALHEDLVTVSNPRRGLITGSTTLAETS
jgi:hypothetical protein